MRRPLRIVVPSGWVAEEVEEYRSLTHELVVVERATPRSAVIVLQPATADMEEVNKLIAEYEAKTGAQPFDMATGERLERVTREQNEVLMVHPIAGG
jgi:hypothetical protein